MNQSSWRRLLGFVCILGLISGNAWAAKVAVIVSRSLPPYKATWSGLSEKSTAEMVRFNMEGSSGASGTILEKIGEGNFDAVVTIGAEATAAASQLTLPLVYTMVLEKPTLKSPQAVGLLVDLSAENKVRFLKQLFPNVTKVGVIYKTENSPKINEFRPYLQAMGLQLVAIAIATPEEYSGALAKMTKDKVDLLWWPVPDVVLLQATIAQATSEHALRQKMPFVALNESQTVGGALGGFSVDYREMGRESAELLKALLNQKRTNTVSYPAHGVFYVNAATQKKLGLDEFKDVPGLKIVRK